MGVTATVQLTARYASFPLHDYDRDTLHYAMGRGDVEFVAAEMNLVLDRKRETGSRGGDFNSGHSLDRLVGLGFLTRRGGRGRVYYRFDRDGLCDFLQNIQADNIAVRDYIAWRDSVTF